MTTHASPLTIESLPTLATIDEVRSVIRCSRSTTRRLIAAGRLKTVKLSDNGGSSRILIPRSSVARFVAELEGVTEAC